MGVTTFVTNECNSWINSRYAWYRYWLTCDLLILCCGWCGKLLILSFFFRKVYIFHIFYASKNWEIQGKVPTMRKINKRKRRSNHSKPRIFDQNEWIFKKMFTNIVDLSPLWNVINNMTNKQYLKHLTFSSGFNGKPTFKGGCQLSSVDKSKQTSTTFSIWNSDFVLFGVFTKM